MNIPDDTIKQGKKDIKVQKLTTICSIIILTLMLSCDTPKPTRPVYQTDSNTTKPIEAFYLTQFNIMTGPYKQQGTSFISEGNTSIHNNQIIYKVHGNHKSKWTKIELILYITDPQTRYQSKYEFAQMLEAIYKHTIDRDTTSTKFKDLILNIISEQIEFIYLPKNEPHIQILYGKITDKRISNVKFKLVKHNLRDQQFTYPKHIITITRYPDQLPYHWKDPYYIHTTITPKQ